MHSQEKQGKYILSIDQSTSASKVMLFDALANLVHWVGLSHRQYYPAEGYVEHDVEEIFDNVNKELREVQVQKSVPVEEVAL